MASQVALGYTIEPAGASSASVAALMAAVPLPADVLQAAGLRVVSDSTPVADPVVRTVTLSWVPSSAPTAVAVLNNTDEVSEVTVTAPGLDLILPPQVTFTPSKAVQRQALARAYLNLQAVNLTAGGSGYSASTFAVVLGAMSPPTYSVNPQVPGTAYVDGPPRQARGIGPSFEPSCVQKLRIAVQGKGYTASAVIQFLGGLDVSNPNARTAKAIITEFGPHGEILGVQITDPGEGYIRVPEVIVVDPGYVGGGFMVTRPNPITGAALNPNTTGAQYGDATPSGINNVKANLAAVMGAGTAATVTLTIAGGVITGAVPRTPGSLYIGVPEILVIDPTGAGSGAAITARMGMDSVVDILSGGKGYGSVPSVVLTPFFETLFPTTPVQNLPFWKFLQTALQVGCLSPVTSSAPVVT